MFEPSEPGNKMIYEFSFQFYPMYTDNKDRATRINYEYEQHDLPSVNSILEQVIKEFKPPFSGIFKCDCRVSIAEKSYYFRAYLSGIDSSMKKVQDDLSKACSFNYVYREINNG